MKREPISTEMKIRRATVADTGALVAFNQRMARETEGRELDAETLRQGVSRLLSQDRYGFYIVAEVEDRVAGSLMITYEWSDWRDGVIWWIQSVYVPPEYRRQGVYSALYAHVRRLAAERDDVRAFRLYVERENTVAQQTYRKLGMEESVYRIYEASV